MATVTGLTAARMLEIEDASIVDGDIVGDNLILTKHGGQQINAGNVRGPQGVQGPQGSDLDVVTSRAILDVGIANQIRAGRQLTATDFTNLGLSAPVGLWNLSDLSDSSGNGRNLSNKGSVAFDTGINGIVTTAAKFNGSNSQVLYISDTGVNDPFRIKTGSIGCWFRSAKRGTDQTLISRINSDGSIVSYQLTIEASNGASRINVSMDGTTWAGSCLGGINVVDDCWHFIVAVFDASTLSLYVDGVKDINKSVTGMIYSMQYPLNIGGFGGDASNNCACPVFGRIDEAFITTDILSEDQIRNLYCAKIGHTLAAVPKRVSLNVRRLRKGAAFVSGDFSTQPLRLYNFSAGALSDEGSNNTTLTNNGTAVAVTGVDGTRGNAFIFSGGQSLSSSDTGLPSGTNSRSYGCWFKTNTFAANEVVMGWGTVSTGDSRLWINTAGAIQCVSAADGIAGPFVGDGLWHFVVATEENAPTDGIKRKLYVDGRLVGISLVLNSITLGGANRFRVGANPDGTAFFTGGIDTVFVCNYVLTPEQIRTLYAKGSQALTPSPKNSGDHIEGMTTTDLFVICDTLESQHQIDLAVA